MHDHIIISISNQQNIITRINHIDTKTNIQKTQTIDLNNLTKIFRKFIK